MIIAVYQRKHQKHPLKNFKPFYVSVEYQGLFLDDAHTPLVEGLRQQPQWHTFFSQLETNTQASMSWQHPHTKETYQVEGVLKDTQLIVSLQQAAPANAHSWQHTSLKDLLTLQQKILNIAKMGTWEYHHLSDKLYPNQTSLAIFGFDHQTFDGRLDTVVSAIHRDDRAYFKARFEAALSQQDPRVELHFRIHNGDKNTLIHVVNRCEITYDAQGLPIRTLGIIQDVSEAVQNQQQQLETQRHLRHVFEGVHDGLAILDENLTLVMVNPWLQAFFNLKPDALGQPCYLAFQGQDSPCAWCDQQSVFKQGESKTFYTPYVNEAGENFELLVSLYPVKDEQDRVTHVIESVRDVTESREQQRILEQERRFQELLAMLARNFLIREHGDFDAAIVMALESLTRFFEVDRGYLFVYTDEGQTMTTTHEWVAPGISKEKDRFDHVPIELFPWWNKQLLKRAPFIISQVSSLPEEAQAEKDILTAQDIESVFIIPIFSGDTLFGFMGFDAVKKPHRWQDIHVDSLRMIGEIIATAYDKEEAYQHIRFLSQHDPLTKSYNRRYLLSLFETLDRHAQQEALLVIDMNGLKLINDALGHEAGDQALLLVAETLNEVMPDDSTIARMGGDEFVVLIKEGTHALLETLSQTFKEALDAKSLRNIKLSAASGYALRASKKQPLKDVLQLAENMMYQHKFASSIEVKNDIITAVFRDFTVRYDHESEHARSVAMLMQRFCEAMQLAPELTHQYVLSAKYHDIGKVTVPPAILTKPGALSEEEYQIIKTHTESGYQLLRSADAFVTIAEAALTHHERYDGTGYPRGLTGETIPLVSRMLAIVEAYAMMTHTQPYAEALTPAQALKELKHHAGAQFDPKLVDLFEKNVYPRLIESN